MPKQVLPTWADFRRIREELIRRDFREISSYALGAYLRQQDLRAPRPKPGRETGFVFHANGLNVFVWTTWLKKEGQARKHDTGWVLICEGDKIVYCAQPIHRTKNFVDNLLRRAWVAMWRVIHRPCCPECNQLMCIVPGRSLKSRYWLCDNRLAHSNGKRTRSDWDHGLPPDAKKYTERLRKQRARYRSQQRQKGRPTYVAMRQRRPWRSSKTPV
jgi:hypothetical protein